MLHYGQLIPARTASQRGQTSKKVTVLCIELVKKFLIWPQTVPKIALSPFGQKLLVQEKSRISSISKKSPKIRPNS